MGQPLIYADQIDKPSVRDQIVTPTGATATSNFTWNSASRSTWLGDVVRMTNATGDLLQFGASTQYDVGEFVWENGITIGVSGITVYVFSGSGLVATLTGSDTYVPSTTKGMGKVVYSTGSSVFVTLSTQDSSIETILLSKSTSTGRSGTTTQSFDPDLQYTTPGAGSWGVEMYLRMSSGGGADFVFNIPQNGSGSNDPKLTYLYATVVSPTQQHGAIFNSSPITVPLNTGTTIMTLAGVIRTTDVWTFGINWAPSISIPESTFLVEGSYIRLIKVA